jgi:hypothetical protein
MRDARREHQRRKAVWGATASADTRGDASAACGLCAPLTAPVSATVTGNSGTISSATILMILSSGLIAGPAVSL